ncbi:MAG: membrane protein insertase YidC [Cyclobacteriaceae bacterium]|nr:membrane protein insertase YidC [Cyclobacteriaceae bacterium]
MDRNTAIGMTLMGALLLAYFYFFPGTPPAQSTAADSVKTEIIKPETTVSKTVVIDSAKQAALKGFGAFANGNETTQTLENNDVRITFSSKGGKIETVELKNYKTYYGKPLMLVEKNSFNMELAAMVENTSLNLYELFYQTQTKTKGDTTFLTFSIADENGNYFKQIYSLPKSGFQIGYTFENNGLIDQVSSESLSLNWQAILKPLEKDIADSRNNTTINTYTVAGDFDYLSERSTDTETEIYSDPVKWISFKQKFFLSAIISKNGFQNAEVSTSVNMADTSVVKRAKSILKIAKEEIKNNKAEFTFYFGPNEYNKLEDVTTGFSENVYLGWPPVKYINKFVIRPIFNFLVNFGWHMGVVIVVLVILLRLVLLPLSYSSNMSMAKMKVLKPELDEIKEKFPDDMAKAQQEQLKLYQQVGVNPLSGCIPVLLQLPILMAMFYLFPNSIELRQQSLWWAEDLSTYDSILTLPFTIPFYGNHVSLFVLLMTAATLYYTWQNNQITTVQGPMKSLSYIMPVVFIFVLNSFPASLSFYYFVSTMTTIIQQIVIKRFVDEDKIKAVMEENRKRISQGGGKKSKFMSRLEDAMKASEEARRKAEEERKKKKNSK